MRVSAFVSVIAVFVIAGQDQRTTGPTQGEWGDQSDGTYVNPVLPGDFSDLDAIRVAEDYYAISSTMQYSPGMAVLHSKDLVNWAIAGHVVDDLTRIDPELNWDKMNRRGRGIWAGSIRYHANKFWVYFGTPDQGLFMSTATNPAGPWTPVQLVLAESGWDDPCPFWDDDEQGYVVTTRFAPEGSAGTRYNVHLFKLTADGAGAIKTSDRIIHQSRGSEANKLYKINGLYYHFYSQVKPEGRVIMMGRANSLSGPWENRQLIHVDRKVDKEPNQGGLMQLPSGQWYFLTHQGTGDWEGRAGCLLPVTWIDGWPVIGRVGEDGIGNMVWRGKKPIQHFPLTSLASDDDFDGPVLKPNWEWNYQPREGMWSLTEHPGSLRLHAFEPLKSAFDGVGDVLTQRSLRTRRNEVTVEMSLAGLADGQEAGLAHFAKTYSTLSVVQSNGTTTLVYNNDGQRRTGPAIPKSALWLRSTWGFDGLSQFAYSLDGASFTPFGEPYHLTWGSYRGDRIGMFTDRTTGVGGYVDVHSFRYKVER